MAELLLRRFRPLWSFEMSLRTHLRLVIQACAITLPAEISAAAVLVRFWDKDVRAVRFLCLRPSFPFDTESIQSSHMAAYISLFVVMVFIVNLFGAR